MPSRTSHIRGQIPFAFALFMACMVVSVGPTFGQVVDAHFNDSLNTNESAYCPHENAIPIDGQVRTSDKSPLPKNVRVILESSQGAFSAQQFPGADGRFHFLTVQGNKYRIIVFADGFQRAAQEVDDEWGANHSPTIFLTRSGKVNSASASETDSDRAAPAKAKREYEKGRDAFQAGNPEEGQKHLEKALSEDPCYARAQTALGVAMGMQGQGASAEADFHNSIKCDPGYLEAYMRLAILLKSQQKYGECQAVLEQAARKFPDEWSVHYQLGNAKAGLGDFPGAEQEFLKAESLNTEPPPELHLRMAEFYRDWRKYDKARAEAETYLHIDPHGPMAGRAKEMVQQLQAYGAVTAVKSPAVAAKP